MMARKNRERRFVQGMLVTLTLALVCVAFSGEETLTTEGPTFDSFHILLNRNIFDPDRYRDRTIRESYEERDFSAPPARSPRIDRISLVGAMIYGGTTVSFFKSSIPDYEKNLELGETIAGFEVSAIRTDRVSLKLDDHVIHLPVGSGLRREGDGDWTIEAESARRESAYDESETEEEDDTEPTEDPDASEEIPLSDSDNEVLKRLMERRKKEMEQ